MVFFVSYFPFKKPFLPIGFWNEMVDLINKILSNIFNRFIHTRRGYKRKGPLPKLQEWASFLSYFLVEKFMQLLLPLSPLRLLVEPLLRYTLPPKALIFCIWKDPFPQESGVP